MRSQRLIGSGSIAHRCVGTRSARREGVVDFVTDGPREPDFEIFMRRHRPPL